MDIQIAENRKTSFYTYQFPDSSNQVIVTHISTNTKSHLVNMIYICEVNKFVSIIKKESTSKFNKFKY